MTVFQRVVKYCAIAFAIYLVVMIFGGILAGVGGLSLITDFFSGEDTSEPQTYTLSQDIGEIEIELGAVDCDIMTGESFSVESNTSKLHIKDGNGRLVISDSALNVSRGARLKIYIPADAQIRRIDISAGAGDIYAERLVCSSLYLECGAGNVKIDEAVATVKADIEGGVGEINIGGGSLNDLDLEMGVGSLELTNRLRGACDLEFGIGDADVTLIGTPEDYMVNYGFENGGQKTSVNIEKGIGTVKVDYAEAG